MSKICLSDCVNIDTVRSTPIRATYVNLYKWPESDAEFMKSTTAHGEARLHSWVVESIVCRQMYLKSYTFSRKETLHEKILKCLRKFREMVAAARRENKGKSRRSWTGQRRCLAVRKVKEFFGAAALCTMFRRALSCTATVDVMEHAV
ncbi:uncharacterized protein [Primulina huaijiensis]|uniref:uncharacterized protein n=1 Tax=Primulina huaijiensis TaxID=1492673 RepID=UPI003CC794EC